MIASLLLVGFGLALAGCGPWLVGRVLRPESAPTLGLFAWLATSLSQTLDDHPEPRACRSLANWPNDQRIPNGCGQPFGIAPLYRL